MIYSPYYQNKTITKRLGSTEFPEHIISVPGMWRVWVRTEECIGFSWGNRRKGDHWGDLGVDGWIILGWISRRWNVGI